MSCQALLEMQSLYLIRENVTLLYNGIQFFGNNQCNAVSRYLRAMNDFFITRSRIWTIIFK